MPVVTFRVRIGTVGPKRILDAQGRQGPEVSYVKRGAGYARDSRYLTTRITADGREGFAVEPGRYRLVVSRACPWASRAVVVRRLLGLEKSLPMAVAGPTHDERSWRFDLDPGGRDPVLGIERLQEAYLARDPHYDRGITVPAVVDVPTGEVVTNDFAQLTIDMSLEWAAYHREGAPALYPPELRAEIDAVNGTVYKEVNNGVYRAGFAGSQESYAAAYEQLFARLDRLTERLGASRYLVGDTITEADVRLFTTLVRFDAVYHGHFKCNRQKLSEMPVLWAYARDLFQTPASATPWTSTTSSVTTTWSTRTSTRPASCPPGRTCRAGSHRTTGRRWAAAPSATAPRPDPSLPRRPSRRVRTPSRPEPAPGRSASAGTPGVARAPVQPSRGRQAGPPRPAGPARTPRRRSGRRSRWCRAPPARRRGGGGERR